VTFSTSTIGYYYLCTVLDDYSRYILSWRLATTMGSTDVEETLNLAVAKTGVPPIRVKHRPRLLSDNGPAFVSDALKKYLKHYQMDPIRGAPYHPQTQGKIERYHRSMKSVVKLDIYDAPSELEQAIASFVRYYNEQRYHEALDNVTPADMYFGRYTRVMTQRESIKQQTLQLRREYYLQTLLYSG
jgi:putative transposase